MGSLFKFVYMGVLVTTMVQAPGQVAAMFLDHGPSYAYQNQYQSYAPDISSHSGYAMACHSLNSMQSASSSRVEAGALGIYRDVIASAASRSGYSGHC